MNNNQINYTVFVGGAEVCDYLVSKEQAESIAEQYQDEGYDDVAVMEVA